MVPTYNGAGTCQQQQQDQDALTMEMLSSLGDRCNLDKSQITGRSKMQRAMTNKNYSKLQIFGPPQQQQTNDAIATGASKALVVLLDKLNLEY
jgi:hypothetical protein